MKTYHLICPILASLSATPAIIPGDIVTNGDFEDPVVENGWQEYLAAFPGWTVGGNGVDIATYEAYPHIGGSGNQFLDLTSMFQGSISQNLPTTPGTYYTLRFSILTDIIGVNFHPYIKIYWGGELLDLNGSIPWDTGDAFVPLAYTHILADSEVTGLTLEGLIPHFNYPFIDNVSVVPWQPGDGVIVPVPVPTPTPTIPDSGGTLALLLIGASLSALYVKSRP